MGFASAREPIGQGQTDTSALPSRAKTERRRGLLIAASSCRNRYIAPIILFAIETGMRRSEILSLRWEHIQRESSSLLIPHTKNGRSRFIPITQAVNSILTGIFKKDARVFPISANAFRLAWERLRARAGATDLHFHDLRHEAISRFFEKGLNVPEVALISGHRDPRMLFRYTHPKPHIIVQKLRGLA